MAVPNDYAIEILLDSVDITAFVPYENLSFEDYATQVSTFKLTIENPSGVTPARGMSIKVYAISLPDAPLIFNGYVIEINSTKRDNGITLVYECDCADMKIRLQKAVLPFNEFTGSDLDILGDLLANAYPDLSSLFDFSTDVNSLLADMDFEVNDESLLDALNRLADEVDADWRLDNAVEQVADTVTFDVGGFEDYAILETLDHLDSAAVTSGGNPGDCAKGLDADDSTGPPSLQVEVFLGADPVSISEIELDNWMQHVGGSGGSPRWSATIRDGGASGTIVFNASLDAVTDDGAWHSSAASTGSFAAWSPPYLGDYVLIRLFCRTTYTSVDLRLDNIAITYGGTGQSNLQWDDEPDPADFDIDIQVGDEFAFDIDLTIGDYDDFNSIIVTGGYEEVAIDWTYESDGEQDHFDLELPVKDLVVYENDGSDGSPSWDALTLGKWGSETLIGDGGSAEVLYDTEKHWLLFDVNPDNLAKAFRITGTIQRPIRVLVEDVSGSDPVFATSVYNNDITSTNEAVAFGQASLEKRNSIKRLSFTTYEPGLKPGQSINVADSARGLDETLKIQRISTKWLGGSGHAQFEIECGEDESTGVDSLVAANDKRSRDKAAPITMDTLTVEFLVDADGITPLIDTDGSTLYEVV